MIILKPGKEKALNNKHHWIFSGAIQSAPEAMEGDIYPVYSSKNILVGHGYFNSQAKIIGRMLSFGDKDPKKVLIEHLNKAFDLRKVFFNDAITNAYRLVNGEGDFLPGLIIDRYNKGLVIQVSTLGMEKLKSEIVNHLIQVFNPSFLYEKSTGAARKEEKLASFEGFILGNQQEVIIQENDIQFFVSPVEGQKTGFFLDHREMRQQVKNLSFGKKVLNCFCYTGGFSLYAAKGGASVVDSVDISKSAIEFAKRNQILNNLDKTSMNFYAEDVFKFLRESPLDYDFVILDPPAFAKRQKDIIPACRGYKDINRVTLQKLKPGTLLLTSSCSYYINEELFQKVVFQAAAEANREVRIIGRHLLGVDHPINIFHPEGDYLKSLLLYVV